MQLGLLLLISGGGLDVLYHAGWAPLLGAYLGKDGAVAHLAILSGMVVMGLGIFARRWPDRAAQSPLREAERRRAIEDQPCPAHE